MATRSKKHKKVSPRANAIAKIKPTSLSTRPSASPLRRPSASSGSSGSGVGPYGSKLKGMDQPAPGTTRTSRGGGGGILPAGRPVSTSGSGTLQRSPSPIRSSGTKLMGKSQPLGPAAPGSRAIGTGGVGNPRPRAAAGSAHPKLTPTANPAVHLGKAPPGQVKRLQGQTGPGKSLTPTKATARFQTANMNNTPRATSSGKVTKPVGNPGKPARMAARRII